MEPQAHVHDFSGFLPVVHIAGTPIPIYFVMTSFAFIVGLLYLVRRGEKRGFSRNRILDVSLVIMFSGFIGSRLFHVFVEEPGYYLARPTLVFDIWSGGFVWYGGALVAGAAGAVFLRLKDEPLSQWLDLFAPVGALGYAIGRTACFATGCCFGQVATLPGFLGGATVRHPTQAYAIAFELVSLVILLRIERLQTRRRAPTWLRQPGQVFFVWLMLHGLGRIFMETFRGDPRGPAPMGLSVSTWLSLALILSSGFFFLRFSRASRVSAL